MDKIDSSINESASFSAKGLAMSKTGQAAAVAHAGVASSKNAWVGNVHAIDSGADGLAISEKASELGPQPPAATTIDARAPTGSSKRLGAYGEAQSSLSPKGSGFDAAA